MYIRLFAVNCHCTHRYLITELKQAGEGKKSVFVPTSSCDNKDMENMYSVKSGVTFHFFSTQIPCTYQNCHSV